jgi:hypothetical protein
MLQLPHGAYKTTGQFFLVEKPQCATPQTSDHLENRSKVARILPGL